MAEEAKLNFVDDPAEATNIQQEQTFEEPAAEVAETEPAQTEEVDAVQQVQGETEEGVLRDEGVDEASPEEIQAPQEEITEIEEITPEQTEQAVEQAVEQAEEQVQTNIELPEGVDKLVSFMQETGGTLEDYISLNRDFSGMSEDALLIEYYSQSKPHWSKQDIKDHLEDEFTFNEEYEQGEELSREDRRKLRLKKEEVNKARMFLEGQKQKYYENIKMNSQQYTQQQIQQQQAQEQAQIEMRQRVEQQNKELFSENFQGFDFNTGEKKFRIKENADKLLDAQNDLSTVLMEHINEDGSIKDSAAYHKAIYAFRNADKIFAQAYQQGKADAFKERAQSTKNIDMTPKTTESSSSQSGPKLSFDVTPPGW